MPPEIETNIALNHLLNLIEEDPDEGFALEQIVGTNLAFIRLGDDTQWVLFVSRGSK